MESLEKQPVPAAGFDDAPEVESFEHVRTLGVFRKFEHFAQHTLKAEIRGIDRVPPELQTDTSYLNGATMWMGGNMVVATFSVGCLGITVFGLNFWDSVLTIIFFTLLGGFFVALWSTFGPRLGLRQMPMSRFWFGHVTVRFVALLNCIACIGWTAVNTMVSAQMLHTVNNGGLPAWGGVLVITLLSFFVSFFGYKVVHHFERWAWVPNFIIFIIVAVRMGKSHAFVSNPLASGPTEAGNVLSFGGTVFGFATGWSTYASDYTVYKPANSNRVKIFFSVYLGETLSIMFVSILGAACATGTLTSSRFLDNYNENSVGGLLYAVLVEDSLHGFGQFCMVVLSLSTISNNIPNLYSLGLSAQTVWSGFHRVPRVIWTCIGCGVSVAIAIPAYYDFANVMSDFMDLIGYWLAFYSAIVISEHYLYRKRLSNYIPEDYCDKSKLPIGISALFAVCCGITGAVVGMDQVWWIGPLARKIGEYGGDIGFELSFAFAFVAYTGTRWLELKYTGR
jgi:NCS1 nucleoside transporter family